MDWDQLRKRLEMLVFLSHLFRDWLAELSLKHILEKLVILSVLNEPVKTNMQYVAGSQPPSQGFSLFLSRMLETVRYVNYSQFD